MKPEAREQSQIVKWAEQVGFVVLTTSEGRAVWRASGLPDLYLIHPALGLALWWEVKAPKGSMTETQEQFQALHEAAGRHAEARSVPGCYVGTARDFAGFLGRQGLADVMGTEVVFLRPKLSAAWREWRAAQTAQKIRARLAKLKRKVTPSPRKRK